jgi:hypothetical protein
MVAEPPVPSVPSVGALLLARVGQLALIFVVVTILILAMSLVANGMRPRPATHARPIDERTQTGGPSGRSESPHPDYRREVWRFT